jgi:hypothetical protein
MAQAESGYDLFISYGHRDAASRVEPARRIAQAVETRRCLSTGMGRW